MPRGALQAGTARCAHSDHRPRTGAWYVTYSCSSLGEPIDSVVLTIDADGGVADVAGTAAGARGLATPFVIGGDLVVPMVREGGYLGGFLVLQ